MCFRHFLGKHVAKKLGPPCRCVKRLGPPKNLRPQTVNSEPSLMYTTLSSISL